MTQTAVNLKNLSSEAGVFRSVQHLLINRRAKSGAKGFSSAPDWRWTQFSEMPRHLIGRHLNVTDRHVRLCVVFEFSLDLKRWVRYTKAAKWQQTRDWRVRLIHKNLTKGDVCLKLPTEQRLSSAAQFAHT